MKEPKIRFKGFEGEWEETTIGKVTMVKRGVRVTRKDLSNGGTFPVYQNTDYPMGYYNLFNVKANNPFVIIGGSAGLIGFSGSDFWAADDCAYFEDDDNLNKKYLYALLLHRSHEIKKNVRGSSVPRLDRQVLSDLDVSLPHLLEQQSIASFFTTLDAQISASTSRLASLKQIKAASLQAMFPQEGETVPKLRFKGFEGEWEKVKLNTFAKRVTRKNTHLESTLALTIASAQGLVSQIDYFNNLVIGSNIRNYYLLNKGEFAYNKSYSNGYPFGSVKRLDRYEKGILSTLYITFSIDDSISSDYLTQFFETTLWHKEVAERSAEGARNHGLLNIGAEDFLTINIVKPQSKEEQQMISDYFISIDRQITLQSQRLEKLKQIKAACLDKMFV